MSVFWQIVTKRKKKKSEIELSSCAEGQIYRVPAMTTAQIDYNWTP